MNLIKTEGLQFATNCCPISVAMDISVTEVKVKLKFATFQIVFTFLPTFSLILTKECHQVIHVHLSAYDDYRRSVRERAPPWEDGDMGSSHWLILINQTSWSNHSFYLMTSLNPGQSLSTKL